MLGRLLPPGKVSGAASSKLAVAKGEATTAVRLALEALGGIHAFVRPGDKVIIKPNASFPNPPSWGSNTSPEVVAALVKLCLEAGAKKVTVVDNTLGNPELCFSRSGLREALAPFPQVRLVAPKQENLYREIPIPKGRALRRTKVFWEVLEAERLINVPTAKSHSATGVSLGLKGLMGLVWDRATFHRDMDLDQAIGDLATVLRPNLTVLDATRALLTAGPGGPGKVEELNTIVAGTDPVAVDAYGVTLGAWYGQRVRPEQVRHLLAARDHGLGVLDLREVEIVEKGA
jgi:uncharacterized protein (DUF362 family)